MKKTRREFLKETIKFLLGLPTIKFFDYKIFKNEEKVIKQNKSKVILTHSNKIWKNDITIDRNILKDMVNISVQKLTEFNSVTSAWRSLFNPKDIVGIKVNCLAGRMLSSHSELVAAIIDGLLLAGVKEENIIIYDRTNTELRRAGFKINTGEKGVKCFGTDHRNAGYDDRVTVIRSVGSCFSRIVSKFCTALINVPVLKDHDLVGVSISLKNHLGSINNPNKFHLNNGNPYIADLNLSPLIRDKTRLIICDAIITSFDGGPSYTPNGTCKSNLILVSKDPVALDYIGLLYIEKKRRENKLPSLVSQNRYPEYINTAADKNHKIGVNKLERINLIKISI